MFRPFYTEEDRSTEEIKKFPKIIQLVSNSLGLEFNFP